MARDPIAKLMEDHQVFLRTVQTFQRDIDPNVSKVVGDSLLPRRIADFGHFLLHDVDRIHGQQEERGLFPALEQYIPLEGGPLEILMDEHEALRDYQLTLDRGGRKLENDPGAEEVRRAVTTIARSVEELLETHVMKEDTVLFPMAYQVLSARELERISLVFDEVESTAGPG